MIRNSRLPVTAALVLLAACGQAPVATVARNDAPPETASSAVPPKAPPAPRLVTIPAGTLVSVRTSTRLSTRHSHADDAAQATLAAPLTVGKTEVAPRGAGAALIVTRSDPGGRVKGRASIGVRLGSLQLAGQATPVSTGTYVREAPGTRKQDAVKAGVLSGAGAAIGAVAGGGKGAAIGAASGAGAGAAVVLATRGAPAEIPAESVLQFRLRQPVTVSLAAQP